MRGEKVARQRVPAGEGVQRRIAGIDIQAPRPRPDRAHHRGELRRSAAVAQCGGEDQLPADERSDQQRTRKPPPDPPVPQDRRSAQGRGQHHRQRIMIIPPPEDREPDDRDRQPAAQQGAHVPLPRIPRRRADPRQRQHDQRPEQLQRDHDIVQLHRRIVGMPLKDREEIGIDIGLTLPHRDIRPRRQQRRHQRHDAQQRAVTDRASHRPGDAVFVPHQPEPDPDAFEQHRIFDLQRASDQRHRGDPAPAATIGPAARDQYDRCGHRQIVEDGRLSALPVRQTDPEDIEDGGGDRPPPPPGDLREPHDERRGRDDGGQRHRLIDIHPRLRRPGRGGEVHQEQPDRLAVPDVDIGQRPPPHRPRHRQVEFLVDLYDGIAEGTPARGDGDEGQEGDDRPTGSARDREFGGRPMRRPSVHGALD